MGREKGRKRIRRDAEKRGFHHRVSRGKQRERSIGRQDATVEILRPRTARAQEDRFLAAVTLTESSAKSAP